MAPTGVGFFGAGGAVTTTSASDGDQKCASCWSLPRQTRQRNPHSPTFHTVCLNSAPVSPPLFTHLLGQVTVVPMAFANDNYRIGETGDARAASRIRCFQTLLEAKEKCAEVYWAPRKISPYGVMTGVRVRSEVDRSILGLSSRLPEVATGFSGVGLIGSTHATERVARRFTRPRPASFQDIRSGACCRRGSSFQFCTARGRCRWCARSRFPYRSFDHQIHARRARAHSSASYWRPSAPH